MKVVKKNVYYCDHCKKRGLSLSHMRTHEWHCTANPNRSCRACENGNIVELIHGFKTRFTLKEILSFADPFEGNDIRNNDSHEVIWTGEPVTLKEVMDSVEGCPNCTLAILRQVGFNRHYFHFDEFKYKELLSKWNNDDQEHLSHYSF